MNFNLILRYAPISCLKSIVNSSLFSVNQASASRLDNNYQKIPEISLSPFLKSFLKVWKRSLLLPSFYSLSIASCEDNCMYDKTGQVSSPPKPIDFKLCDALPQGDIIKLVRRSKKMIDEEYYSKQVEDDLQLALKSAIVRQDRQTVAYIQAVLAHYYSKTSNLDKAEVMYKYVLQNLTLMNTPQKDPAVLDVNIKLAVINGHKNEHEKAKCGFEWCISFCRKELKALEEKDCKTNNVKESPESIKKEQNNLLKFLALGLEFYSRYLHRVGKNEDALELALEALEICKKVYSKQDVKVLLLHNDIASIKCDQGLFEEALSSAIKAVDLAEDNTKVTNADKATFYSNLASIYVATKNYELADEAFHQSWEEIIKCKDERLRNSIALMIAKFNYDLECRRKEWFNWL